MRDAILRLVRNASGIVAQKLLYDLQMEYSPTLIDIAEFNQLVDTLVEKGDIVRVQYVIPPNGHKMRTGALYLPERSVVIVNTRNDRTMFKSQR